MQDDTTNNDTCPNIIIHSNNSSNNGGCFDSVDLQTNIVRKGMPASLPLWFDSEVQGRLGVKLSFHPKELSVNHHRHHHHYHLQQPSKCNVSGASKLTTIRSLPLSTLTSQTSRKRLKAMDGSELLFASNHSDKDEDVDGNGNGNCNGKASIEVDSEDHRNDYKLAHERIPAASRKYESDLIVVLDLDECLIHTEQVSTYGMVDLPLFREGVLFPFDSDVEWTDIQDDEYMTTRRIYLRPYVLEFLQSVSSRFETHLFTAGTRGYADFILQKFLDTDETIFAYVHAREECTFKEDDTYYYKDLRVVFDQRKTRQQQQQQQQQQPQRQQETWYDDQDGGIKV